MDLPWSLGPGNEVHYGECKCELNHYGKLKKGVFYTCIGMKSRIKSCAHARVSLDEKLGESNPTGMN